jgi:hypothetical protein
MKPSKPLPWWEEFFGITQSTVGRVIVSAYTKAITTLLGLFVVTVGPATIAQQQAPAQAARPQDIAPHLPSQNQQGPPAEIAETLVSAPGGSNTKVQLTGSLAMVGQSSMVVLRAPHEDSDKT